MFDKSSILKYQSSGHGEVYFKDQVGSYLWRVYTRRRNNPESQVYLVQVDRWKNDLMIVKFYLRKDKNDKTDAKFRKSFRNGMLNNILVTVLEICEKLLSKYPNVSFAFQGAPKDPDIEEDEKSQDAEATIDESVEELSGGKSENEKKPEGERNEFFRTQRFRIYMHAIKNRVSAENFAHRFIEKHSIYCLINQRHSDPDHFVKSSIAMFQDNSAYFRDNIDMS